MPKGEKLLAYADPEHPRFFAEFARWEKAAGGPDPHMATVGQLVRPIRDPFERLWRVGIYLSVYNVPTAEAIWDSWTLRRALLEGEALEPWLREHWAGIVTRRERKAVRRPEQLARCLASLARWVRGQPEVYRSYDEAWESALGIYSFGRYITIKFLEAMRRYVDGTVPALDDLRAAGGWSPREGLALIYPEHSALLFGRDTVENLAAIEDLARRHRLSVAHDFGVSLTAFEHQVLLCDYKQSYVGMRQYPGRSLDSELEYHAAIAPLWPEVPFEMFDARRALFPEQGLGEVRGWAGVRRELGTVLRQHRYTWSDQLYQYPVPDLAAPVAWA